MKHYSRSYALVRQGKEDYSVQSNTQFIGEYSETGTYATLTLSGTLRTGLDDSNDEARCAARMYRNTLDWPSTCHEADVSFPNVAIIVGNGRILVPHNVDDAAADISVVL